MKKTLAGIILLLICLNSVCAAESSVIRQNPYINNPYYRHHRYYENEVLPRDLSALEKYSMSRVYSREHPVKRLERLETLAFGSVQAGDIESRYHNVENAILSRPKSCTKRTVFGNLANYFSGQPTGVTPSVFANYGNGYSYDNYGLNHINNGYGTSRINQYSNGIFGGGYGILNNNFGNGSSIRILD